MKYMYTFIYMLVSKIYCIFFILLSVYTVYNMLFLFAYICYMQAKHLAYLIIYCLFDNIYFLKK